MFSSPVPFELSSILLFSPWALCRQDRVLGTKSEAEKSETKTEDGLISASLLIGRAESVFRHYKTSVKLHLQCTRVCGCTSVITAGLQHKQCYFNIFCTALFVLQLICLGKTFQLQ